MGKTGRATGVHLHLGIFTGKPYGGGKAINPQYYGSDNMRICVLASGSEGNVTYVETGTHKILLDIGMNVNT